MRVDISKMLNFCVRILFSLFFFNGSEIKKKMCIFLFSSFDTCNGGLNHANNFCVSFF